MLIHTIILENVGLYSGYHEVDVSPVDGAGVSKPIILVGGMNGAGKTTLLESVKLCLYGKLALGSRTKQTDYDQHLLSLIHRPKDGGAPHEAAVGLDFSFSVKGVPTRYRVTRRWARVGTTLKVNEHLDLVQDGKPLEDLEGEFWQDFVNDLLPPGLSELFFFDGEKIQDLADETDGRQFAASVESLLGLDLVDRIQTDLSLFLRRNVARRDGSTGLAIAELESQLRHKNKERADVANDIADVQADIDGFDCQIRDQQARLSSLGSETLASKSRNQAQRDHLESAVSDLEQQMREHLDSSFVLHFCPKLNRRLVGQLVLEENAQRVTLEQEIVQQVLAEVTSISGQVLPTEHAIELAEALAASFHFNASARDTPIVHGLSNGESAKLRHVLTEVLPQKSAAAAEMAADYERRVRSLRDSESRLKQTPDEAHLGEYLSAWRQSVEQRQQLADRRVALQAQLNAVEAELTELTRKLTRETEKGKALAGHQTSLDLLDKCSGAFSKYRDRLKGLKISKLSQEVRWAFQELSRKSDLISDVEINPDNLQVKLMTDKGVLSKQQLSAGEKQIFAIAALWGLARASQRPLPLIIDTPLARLDSEHRKNLTANYFPAASHQVIILSTDTEVDRELMGMLNGSLAKTYKVEYSTTAGCSTIQPDYFWGQN